MITDNYTLHARRSLAIANQLACERGYRDVGPAHILLALLRRPDGGAAIVLQASKRLDKMREGIDRLVGPGPGGEGAAKLPINPAGKEVLQHAVAESKQLGHAFVGTEHLLLGILMASTGEVARELARSGLTLRGVRELVVKLIPPSAITGGEYLDEATLAKRKRALEEHQQRVEEDRRIVDLRAMLADRQEAAAIRDLLSDLCAAAHRGDIVINEESALGRWATWAANRAETLDPIPRLLSQVAGGVIAPSSHR